MILQAIIVTIFSALSIVFYRDKPATPPSFSANIAREDFKKSLTLLIHNRTYVLIVFCFSLIYGSFIDLAVILGQLINPFGFDSSSTSILSVCTVSSGIVGSFFIIT